MLLLDDSLLGELFASTPGGAVLKMPFLLKWTLLGRLMFLGQEGRAKSKDDLT